MPETELEFATEYGPLGPTDWYYRNFCPTDPYGNVEFRDKLWTLGRENHWAAQELWTICARDLLFYLNVFGFLLEPRDKEQWEQSRPFGTAREIPFITREEQNAAFLELQQNLGNRDVLILKSRAMGATWMVLYLFDWAWRFHPENHFGIVSKDEDSVDSADNPDSLMAKLDFIDEHLPMFLQPRGDSGIGRRRSTSRHTLVNLENRSTITGYSCTGDMARGGRKRAFFMDEAHAWPPGDDEAAMASTQHVCPSRIMCSTPNPQRGQAGMFYDVVMKEDANIARITLAWHQNKEKSAGLYRTDGNDLKILDPTYPFPPDYKFIYDGKLRSPYYDYECARAGSTDQKIAAELDMDFGGATRRFFKTEVIKKGFNHCADPHYRCLLVRQSDSWIPKLKTSEHGDIDIWVPPDVNLWVDDQKVLHIPRARMFAMGIDISQGLGGTYSSYSAIVILDRTTGRQVAEFRHNKMYPVELAEYANILGVAWNYALLCAEVTGIGEQFQSKIIQLGYQNLWYRPRDSESVSQATSIKPNYRNTDKGKTILGEMQRAMQSDKITIYSRRVIQECERYFEDEKGDLKHPLVGKGRPDSPEKSHGDSAIACAVAWWSIHEEDHAVAPVSSDDDIPMGSFAERRRDAERIRNGGKYGWTPFEEQRQFVKW